MNSRPLLKSHPLAITYSTVGENQIIQENDYGRTLVGTPNRKISDFFSFKK